MGGAGSDPTGVDPDLNVSGEVLPVEFYERDVVTVARELIGCVLRRETDGTVVAGRIVETEAYRHDEPASHAYTGKSARNAAMFGPAGHAYVYLIYGMYECFNVVCGPAGVGNAVLIRAVEPVEGIARMFENRFGSGGGPTDGATDVVQARSRTAGNIAGSARGHRPEELTSGPGKLCRAFGITREVDGMSLVDGPVTIHAGRAIAGGAPTREIVATRRIGISKATELEWRFVEAGNEYVSRRVR
jgi:DNA-3-methyladenine glycosylase